MHVMTLVFARGGGRGCLTERCGRAAQYAANVGGLLETCVLPGVLGAMITADTWRNPSD